MSNGEVWNEPLKKSRGFTFVKQIPKTTIINDHTDENIFIRAML